MSIADAKRAKGLVQFAGKWRSRAEVMHLKKLRRNADPHRIQRDANRLLVRLASRDAATRRSALAGLEALAETYGMPDLSRLGRRQAAIYAAFWREHGVTPRVAAQ